MPRRKRELKESEGEDAGGGPPPSPPPVKKKKRKKKKSRHLDPRTSTRGVNEGSNLRTCRKTSEGRNTQIVPVEAATPSMLENGLSEVLTKELPKVLTKLLPKVLTKILPKVLPRFLTCSPSTLVNQYHTPRYKLSFMNGLNARIFTRKTICDTNGDRLKIRVIANCQEEIDARILYAKIRVVVLDGDFNSHNQECWTWEEFSSSIVRPRDKTGAILTGVSELSLTDGEAHLSGFTFVDNSKFVRSGKFRLGVMVVDDFGERVQEGITEPFIVMDRRGEGSKKHEIPLLNDDVWRLKMIAKGGSSHGALKNSGILFVKDFLSLYYKDEQHLREILNIGTKESAWTTTIEHAKKCDPGTELYSFAVEGNNVMLFFNSVCQIVGVKFGDSYTPFDDLEKSKKDLVIQWSKLAYKNMTYDQSDYEMDNGEPRPIDQEMFHECIDPIRGFTAEADTSGSQWKQHQSNMLETQNGKSAQLQEQQHLDEPGQEEARLQTQQDLDNTEEVSRLREKQHIDEPGQEQAQQNLDIVASRATDTVTQSARIELENTELRAQVAELRAQLAELRDRRFNEMPGFVNSFSALAMGIQGQQPMTRSSSHSSISATLTTYPSSTDDASNACDPGEDFDSLWASLDSDSLWASLRRDVDSNTPARRCRSGSTTGVRTEEEKLKVKPVH
ncbi:hypothetical protein EJB05_01175, partial [Eragrostis curvula]